MTKSEPDRPRAILVLAMAAMFTLAGCGGGDPQAAVDIAEADIVFVATDFAYEPNSTTLEAGQATIALDNQGSVPHDWTIEGLEDTTALEATPDEQVTETIDLQAGTYTYYCTIPGHRASGMEGTLTIN